MLSGLQLSCGKAEVTCAALSVARLREFHVRLDLSWFDFVLRAFFVVSDISDWPRGDGDEWICVFFYLFEFIKK